MRFLRRNSKLDFLIRRAAIISVVVTSLSSLLLNSFLHEELYLMGLNFIYDYQTNYANGFATVFYNAVSFLGYAIFIPLYLICIFAFSKRRLRTTTFLTYFIFNLYLISLLKNSFESPRPFWEGSPI